MRRIRKNENFIIPSLQNSQIHAGIALAKMEAFVSRIAMDTHADVRHNLVGQIVNSLKVSCAFSNYYRSLYTDAKLHATGATST